MTRRPVATRARWPGLCQRKASLDVGGSSREKAAEIEAIPTLQAAW